MSSKCTKDPNKNIPLSTESRRARAQGVAIEMIIPLGKEQVDTYSNNLKHQESYKFNLAISKFQV